MMSKKLFADLVLPDGVSLIEQFKRGEIVAPCDLYPGDKIEIVSDASGASSISAVIRDGQVVYSVENDDAYA